MLLDLSGEMAFWGPLVGPLEDNFEERIEKEEEQEYIVVPLGSTVVFPHMMAPLFIGRNRSVRAVEAAMATDSPILVVAQRNSDKEDPEPDDLYTVGTEVIIGRTLRMPDGSTSLLSQGRQRVQIIEFTQRDPFLRARGIPVWEEEHDGLPTEALMRAVLALFEKCVQLSPNLPEEAYVAAMNVDEPGWLADLIASVLDMPVEEKQELLETFDTTARLQRLSILLGRELDVLELENRIQQQVQEEMDRSQREYFLREQMRVIQSELGEADEVAEIPRVVGEAVEIGAAVLDVVGAIAHRLLERDGVRRVGHHEVEAPPLRSHIGHNFQAVAVDDLLDREVFLAAHLLVYRQPALVDIDSRGDSAAKAGADEGAADAAEGVEHRLAGLGEELDDVLHQLWRLVGPVLLAEVVAVGRGIASLKHRLGEIEPLVPRQLVQAVPWMNPISISWTAFQLLFRRLLSLFHLPSAPSFSSHCLSPRSTNLRFSIPSTWRI